MTKGTLYVVLCYILSGLVPIFWKLLQELNSVYVLACRIVFSLIICAIILGIEGNGKRRIQAACANRKQLWLLLASSILVTLNWGLYIVGVNSGQIIECSLACFINPIMTIVFGLLIFHEKLRKLQWLALGFAAVGVLIPILQYGHIPYFALVLGSSFSLYSVVKKKITVDGQTSVFMETLFASPFALLFILYAEFNQMGAGRLSAWLGISAAASRWVGNHRTAFIVFHRRKSTPMSVVGVVMYITPILQLLIGVLLYNESFTPSTLTTFIFVIVAIFLFFADKLLWQKQAQQSTPDLENQATADKNRKM